MTKRYMNDLLERYLTDQCTPGERQLIDEWFERRDQPVSMLSEADAQRLAEEMLAAIQQRAVWTERRDSMRMGRSGWWRSIAAAVLLFAGLGYVLLSQRETETPLPKGTTPQLAAFQTQPGQRAKLTLPDSSVIWLNGGTSLKYDKVFDGATREVFLEAGEAFFEVHRNPARPFVVHADEFDTRVLGTSFNIEVANHRNEYRLTVSTGKVGARQPAGNMPTTLLEAGQQLVYRRGDRQYRVLEVNPETYSAWTQRELLLRNATWPEIADRLGDWYGVNVKLQLGRSANETFTARFENPSLEGVLKALQKINKFQYTINRKEVRITD